MKRKVERLEGRLAGSPPPARLECATSLIRGRQGGANGQARLSFRAKAKLKRRISGIGVERRLSRAVWRNSLRQAAPASSLARGRQELFRDDVVQAWPSRCQEIPRVARNDRFKKPQWCRPSMGREPQLSFRAEGRLGQDKAHGVNRHKGRR